MVGRTEIVYSPPPPNVSKLPMTFQLEPGQCPLCPSVLMFVHMASILTFMQQLHKIILWVASLQICYSFGCQLVRQAVTLAFTKTRLCFPSQKRLLSLLTWRSFLLLVSKWVAAYRPGKQVHDAPQNVCFQFLHALVAGPQMRQNWRDICSQEWASPNFLYHLLIKKMPLIQTTQLWLRWTLEPSQN